LNSMACLGLRSLKWESRVMGDLIARFREHLCMWCKWTCTKKLNFQLAIMRNKFLLFTMKYEGEKKPKKAGLNCVCFFFFFSYWSDNQNLNAADKTERERERERERRKTQSNYTGSFHKPEVVLSPLHFQGEFTKM